MNNNPIGVFDSGVGGLTCVRELARLLPNEEIVYLGDTARIPYGSKSAETVARYARQDIAFLESCNVKMIIAACGTVSAVMTKNPVYEKNAPFTGVLLPAVQAACAATRSKRIGVIGTSATIKSGAYGKAIHAILPDAVVAGKACPMFVPLVENGYTDRNHPVTRMIAEEYLTVLKEERIDTLILGCTHYPLLEGVIADVMGSGVTLISSGAEAAKYAVRELTKCQMLTGSTEKGKLQLFCTDSKELFTENVGVFLGGCADETTKIAQCSVE